MTENNLTIAISEDGTVSGSFHAIFDSGANVFDCGVSHVIITENGTFSGLIAGPSGSIEAEITQIWDLTQSECHNEDEVSIDTDILSATISVSGNTLTGLISDWLTFEATKIDQ